MLNFRIYKALFYLKRISFSRAASASPSPICHRLLQHYRHPLSPLSLKFGTITSDQHSFPVSYLINNCGFSPETALNASKYVRFETAEKADSVLALFRNHGFSNSQINSIIRRATRVLLFDPHKTLLPKFEFLVSKGASSSDIVLVVTRSPRFLYVSLKNKIIPTYELVRRFFQSDKKAVDCLVLCPNLFGSDRVAENVKLLLDDGVTEININHLLRTRPSILMSYDMRKVVDEVKELGFHPSKVSFGSALLAKRAVSRSRWDEKVDAFKTWGWSEGTILEAFRRQPNCMLASKDKINAVMSFWVNQLGWNSLAPVKRPQLFGFNLEKRIIPRAFVVQYLLENRLMKKNASIFTPFDLSEKLFLKRFVKCFKEESSQLLRLYQQKLNLQDSREDSSMIS